MSAESDIYSFETIFPDALKSVFTDKDIKSFTLSDAPDFQKDRPRVDIVFIPGTGQLQWREITIGGNPYPRETSWKAQWLLTLTTDSDKPIHTAYISLVRSLMHGVAGLINFDKLPLHRVQNFLRDEGTQSDFSTTDQGYYQTRLMIGCDFSIQDEALQTLNT